MFESKKIGRGLSVVAGATLGYLINRVQEERQPADILGYSLKTTGAFFLGQYAYNNEQEIILRSLISYWAYETMRLSPLGKPDNIAHGASNEARGNPYETAMVKQHAVQGLLTPENMHNVGSALKGLSSLLNGLKGE